MPFPFFRLADGRHSEEKMNIRNIVASALGEFEAWLLSYSWRGKENDCVNLFAHRFLAYYIAPDSVLHDLTQIGIEVCVPKPPKVGIKPAVRKDLVIWREPLMTTWSAEWTAETFPLAIIEWKARRRQSSAPVLSQYDLNWLTNYSPLQPDFTGFCVTVDFTSTTRRVASAIVANGQISKDFHRRTNQFVQPRS